MTHVLLLFCILRASPLHAYTTTMVTSKKNSTMSVRLFIRLSQILLLTKSSILKTLIDKQVYPQLYVNL